MIETLKDAKVRWSMDGWKSSHNTEVRDSGLGVYYADLPTDQLLIGSKVAFTFFWPQANKWEGKNFEVSIHSKSTQATKKFKDQT